ncbi:autotransporter-associated beta strand protein [Ereboglobus sp. PH5-5]|uniref:autotransporter family protein n=1 Tax=Ereboglobus sp. PH5-5 TaxID=2940529 RepID=UPI002406536C|nr:autotransporter domain-containing protein [Ereboglobus sp. PH5-5]MDF9834207.1 autotransporter-associated beta strand protein [Ereboglobus sp. PH5-5]
MSFCFAAMLSLLAAPPAQAGDGIYTGNSASSWTAGARWADINLDGNRDSDDVAGGAGSTAWISTAQWTADRTITLNISTTLGSLISGCVYVPPDISGGVTPQVLAADVDPLSVPLSTIFATGARIIRLQVSEGSVLTFDNNGSASQIKHNGWGNFHIYPSLLLNNDLEITNYTGKPNVDPFVSSSYVLLLHGTIEAGAEGLKTITLMAGASGEIRFSNTSQIADGAGRVALVHDSGNLLQIAGTNNTFTGGLTVNSGTLQITGNDGSLGAVSNLLTVNDGGVLNLSPESGSMTIDAGRATTLTSGSVVFETGASKTTNWDGVIDGGASLVIRGSGSSSILNLNGANTYAGATTVESGFLRINGDMSAVTSPFTIASGALLGGTGVIGGSVTIAAGATLVGASGQTLVFNNGLALGDASIISVTLGDTGAQPFFQVNGDLALNGTIDVEISEAFAPGVSRLFDYTGTLSGTGLSIGTVAPEILAMGELLVLTDTPGAVDVVVSATTKNYWRGGNGTWSADPGSTSWQTWSGETGAWEENFATFAGTGGTVRVDNAHGPVLATGMQFTNDGYVLTGGTLTLSGTKATFRLGTGAATDSAITARIDAAIAGTTDILKSEAGTLVLGGNNTFTGAVRIEKGAIELDNSSLAETTVTGRARLSGHGVIRGNLIIGGTLAPGTLETTGAMTVEGNYRQSTGTLLIKLASEESHDRLLVSGSASLNGSLRIEPLAGFAIQPGAIYKIIEAGAGISGTFSNIYEQWGQVSPLVRFEVFYGARDVSLSFTKLPVATIGATGTPNQFAISEALDAAGAQGFAGGLASALLLLPTEDAVLRALNEISPQRYQRWFEQAAYSTGMTMRAAEHHLARVPDGSKWVLWAQGVSRDSRFSSTDDIPQADADARGVIVGMSRAWGKRFKSTLLVSFTDEQIDLDAADSRTDVGRYLVALGGRYDYKRFFLDVIAGGGVAALDNYRVAGIPGYNRAAEGDTNSSEAFAGMRLGWRLKDRYFDVTPYIGAQYIYWKASGLQETGADDAALRVGGQSAKSFTARVGMSVAKTFRIGSLVVTPVLESAASQEFCDGHRTINASMGGQSFAIRTPNLSDSIYGVTASAGVNIACGENTLVVARFTGEWSPFVERATSLDIGLQLRF